MIKKVEIISAVSKVKKGDKESWKVARAGIYTSESYTRPHESEKKNVKKAQKKGVSISSKDKF